MNQILSVDAVLENQFTKYFIWFLKIIVYTDQPHNHYFQENVQ